MMFLTIGSEILWKQAAPSSTFTAAAMDNGLIDFMENYAIEYSLRITTDRSVRFTHVRRFYAQCLPSADRRITQGV